MLGHMHGRVCAPCWFVAEGPLALLMRTARSARLCACQCCYSQERLLQGGMALVTPLGYALPNLGCQCEGSNCGVVHKCKGHPQSPGLMLRISKAVKDDIGNTTLRAAGEKQLGRRPVLVEFPLFFWKPTGCWICCDVWFHCVGRVEWIRPPTPVPHGRGGLGSPNLARFLCVRLHERRRSIYSRVFVRRKLGILPN